jgi:hypothetical protein
MPIWGSTVFSNIDLFIRAKIFAANVSNIFQLVAYATMLNLP